ncbi:MAG: DNA oxidative demethylase AlkB [Moraxellaceae bacterium]|nr:DNA oxidative demethylase AlkB [Moraxellaceae bacterium]
MMLANDCPVELASGLVHLPQVLLEPMKIVNALTPILQQAPLRHMQTRRGFKLSAAMSNCGALGWVSDRLGYRYQTHDPETGKPWPEMPVMFSKVAVELAARAGYAHFRPDVCLINCYAVGAKMALHQDADEQDFSQPIVSLSFGLPVLFLWGGLQRSDPVQKIVLDHSDALVWGGSSRLNFHGVASLRKGNHPLLGEQRINLTFRRAC